MLFITQRLKGNRNYKPAGVSSLKLLGADLEAFPNHTDIGGSEQR
jgi:hypothetical protein